MRQQNNPAHNFRIQEVNWDAAGAALKTIRSQVFIEEQQVPIALEWDGLDDSAIHILALDNETPIGCARILQGGIIGRMAVLNAYRNMGIGHSILAAAIAICRREQWFEIKLSAQMHALAFYQKAGFSICSSEYIDAGIPHKDMVLDLSI
ncbi:hypothetical protein A7981_01095 [Methylovorus sp. MM2]|uniref:GNAT family N-acetyltransferase n=1 Tax=Methylovorus sp. MM2 TaxID=1848038 RepID=UPI0007E1EFC2|nr:GNAT family N-acetyltransferase [Methylovorus sp. MM2]OAM52115.1 hypothetical protein A7981_01095 [Methylovorus sp. MM2]